MPFPLCLGIQINANSFSSPPTSSPLFKLSDHIIPSDFATLSYVRNAIVRGNFIEERKFHHKILLSVSKALLTERPTSSHTVRGAHPS